VDLPTDFDWQAEMLDESQGGAYDFVLAVKRHFEEDTPTS